MTDPQVPPNDPPKNDPPPKDEPPKDDPPKDEPPKDEPPKDEDRGYPKDTALADMTVEQQAAYWRYHAQKHERSFKSLAGKDMTPEKVAELLAEKEKRDREAMTPSEQALADARKEAREEALREATVQNVRLIMDSHVAASGLDKSKAEDQDVIDAIQALDPSTFIKEGQVDAGRLTKVLNRIIPAKGSTSGTWPDTGQGRRETGTGSAKDAGKAEAARRWPDKVKTDT